MREITILLLTSCLTNIPSFTTRLTLQRLSLDISLDMLMKIILYVIVSIRNVLVDQIWMEIVHIIIYWFPATNFISKSYKCLWSHKGFFFASISILLRSLMRFADVLKYWKPSICQSMRIRLIAVSQSK